MKAPFMFGEKEEIRTLLTPQEFDLFCFRYGVRDDGNAKQDPHGEFTGKKYSVRRSPHRGSRAVILDFPLMNPWLCSHRPKRSYWLRETWVRAPAFGRQNSQRLERFDDFSLCCAAQTLEDFRTIWLSAQKAAARFLRKNLYDEKTKPLYRSWRDGAHSTPARLRMTMPLSLRG